MGHVARVVDEGDVARLRLIDAGDAGDVDVPVAFEPAAELPGKVTKLHQRARCTLRGSRVTFGWRSGRPACSHALMMTDAVAVMAADSCRSIMGFTFWKNASKYASSYVSFAPIASLSALSIPSTCWWLASSKSN